MGNVAIIEVVIGMIFVYSLLSILVTQINTLIINFLNLRAKRLKEGLEKLLTDPVVRAKILAHPLIGMFETVKLAPEERITSQQALDVTQDERAKISWIESSTFVDVLVDVLTGGSTSKLYTALTQAVDAIPVSVEKSQIREMIRNLQISGQGMPQLRDLIRDLKDESQRQALLNALNMVEDALDMLKVESSDLIPLLVGVKQIQGPYLQSAIEAVLNAANSFKDAQAKLGEWFDNAMGRSSERFQREMQRFSLGIGLMLALILNVDSLQLARTLWEDPALREAAVAAASEANQVVAGAGTGTPTTAAENPIPDASGTGATDAQAQTADTIEESADVIRATVQQLLNLRLPIGWEWTPITPEMISFSETTGILTDPRANTRNLWNYFPGNNSDWFGLLLKKIVGLIVTTIAVAQGAPFWFDLLNRLTGKKQS